jgi:hypothetical protein
MKMKDTQEAEVDLFTEQMMAGRTGLSMELYLQL